RSSFFLQGVFMTFPKVLVSAALAIAALSVWLLAAEAPVKQSQRAGFQQAYSSGNYKVAYEGFRKLALDPNNDALLVSSHLSFGISALQQLGRVDEIDEFREAVIDVHKGNWRLLETAAQSYLDVDHQGFIVAGKFYRGRRRGGGKYVTALFRDRVRALQLMQMAAPLVAKDDDHKAAAQFELRFAGMFLMAGAYEAWRLQTLTDLTKLPDFDDGYAWRGGTNIGAPVDAEGNPVLYRVPKSLEAAQSDGERWRWLLAQAVELDPAAINEAQSSLANFL